MKLRPIIYILFLLILIPVSVFSSVQRFPKPEFEQGHTQPLTIIPQARSVALEYFDVFVLIACLSIVSWFVIKKRSRNGVLVMTIFSIAYFGFFRKGCVCPVGSLQNVSLALFDPSYVIPITTILIFLIPLFFTLLFGRTFCAGVCPLGAIQDIVAIKPIPIKKWIQSALGLFPFIYLALAVLYSITATDFIICRYDPFIGVYRLNASFFMLSIGALLLLIGVFIARPYCRFICPYGVLLNWISRFSLHHVTITPTSCINCNLCESSCPYDAIDKPTPIKLIENRHLMVKRLIVYTLIIPFLMLMCGYAASRLSETFASVNSKVHLANEGLIQSKNEQQKQSIEVLTFKGSGEDVNKLYQDTKNILKQFYYGSWILGLFVGLVVGIILANLSIYKYRQDYRPNKATCLSCARCTEYCPVERVLENVNKIQTKA